MPKRIAFFLFFLSLFCGAKADTIPATIYGSNAEYKNAVIRVYGVEDYITGQRTLLARDTVDENGDFKIEIPTREICSVSMDLGQYEGVLFLSPGSSYRVVLPPYEPLTMAEMLNPYYQPTQIYMGIEQMDKSDINYQMGAFDEVYYEVLRNNYYRIYKEPKREEVDSLIAGIETQFDSIQSPFFKDYRNYKYVWLRYVSYMRDYRYIIRDYFNGQPVLYNNPAYMDLFNQLFTNYLSFYMSTSEGERLYSDIALAKSPKFIKETFTNNMVLTNDTLQELVLLKGLHDAFYSNDFPSKSLAITLDSLALLTRIPQHKLYATNIEAKVTKAKAGQAAPGFALKDCKGIPRNLNDLKSNYVYLNFCSVESFTCQQDLALLKTLHEKHKESFRIVSISIDEDFSIACDYFKKNGYDWMLLSYEGKHDLLDAYKVRAYPTYFVIDPEGRLAMSPARGPKENFEWVFFKLLQEREHQKLRNQKKP